jgi:hypothetical protein
MNSSSPSAPAERAGADVEPGRHPTVPRGGFGIAVDGAVGYSLRVIPSNKVLGRFASVHDAWPSVIAAVEAGRSSRTLVLDWCGMEGPGGKVASGATLEYLARSGLGLPAEHLRPAGRRER